MEHTSGIAPNNALILMRHAARAGGQDRLSAEGHKQAEGLPKLLETKILKHFRRNLDQADLICSPKLRTQQTVRFLSENLSTKIETRQELDERTNDETQADLEMRVKLQLSKWYTQAESVSLSNSSKSDQFKVTIACSHLDWLEAASLFIESDELEHQRAEPWAPLGLKIYGFQNGIWRRFQ